MSMDKQLDYNAYMSSLLQQTTTPVFPALPNGARPYILATTLFAATSALMTLDSSVLLRYGLPWALMALLVVVATANLWGVRPAILVLALSAIWGMSVIPHLTFLTSQVQLSFWKTMSIRTSFFLACGIASIWLAYRARVSQERADLRRDVVVALQSIVTANSLAKAPGFDTASVYRPARLEEEVGGDFYDFYPCANNKYAVLIGDVMGKGKEAAVCTALLRYSVRAFTSRNAGPAQTMRYVNNLIETQGLPFETATMFLGFLDTGNGRLTYANAGHEPPMLKGGDGRELSLAPTGPILGIGVDMPYDEEVVILDYDDSLLLITDGVTEARNPSGAFLKAEGAWRLFREALREPSPKRVLESINSSVSKFIRQSPSDDIAMLLLHRRPDLAILPSEHQHRDEIWNLDAGNELVEARDLANAA